MKVSLRLAAVPALALLAGSAYAANPFSRSHGSVADSVETARLAGGIPAAIEQLDSSAPKPAQKAALLYNMERGQLLRLNKDVTQSTVHLLEADALVTQWEETAKGTSKVMGTVGKSLLGERFSAYEGRDYEKVWLTTMLAMNRLASNDLDSARVDIKRTHEREAVIATFRAKETEKAKKEAEEKGATTENKEIDGYPIETINDPAVLELKNGYQNALSHYLAGFVYELTNEGGLAAPGYRQAVELRPGAGVLEEGLRGLDKRLSGRGQKMTDVLFVIEAGNAPARTSKSYMIPVIIPGATVSQIAISFPEVLPAADPLLVKLEAGGQSLKLDKVVDINVMARREIKDEMPGLMLRNITRAAAKGVATDQLSKRAGLFGAVAGMALAAKTETADDRIWRSLPGRVYLARGYLPQGEQHLTIDGRDAGTVAVSGRHALISLRVMDDGIIALAPGSFGDLPKP